MEQKNELGDVPIELSLMLMLLDTQKEYIEFLDKHLSSVSSIAMIHGFRFKPEDIERGNEFRVEIASLKAKMRNPNSEKQN